MNPKLALNGRIYMLTVGSVLATNVSQTNLCQLFVQSYSQSQARLMFVATLGMDNFDCTKMNAHFKKFTACLRESFPECLIPKCLIPECLIPKCLMPKCLTGC